MARVSRPTTANKMTLIGMHSPMQLMHPNWDAFSHAAHASLLGSCNYYMHVHVCTVHVVHMYCT